MKSFNYSDIYLVPKYSELKSRSEADISVEFLGKKFNAPWLPANMESVIDEKIARWLSENDYFYIYHRFGDTKQFVHKANQEKWKIVSISLGVKDSDKELIESLLGSAYIIDFVTIDVAHGHSVLVKEMISFIKDLSIKHPRWCKPKIIAGNVATPEAVMDLAAWGADAVKVGIAGGAACSTKNQTGFHIPMFSCVKDCSSATYIDYSRKLFAIEKVKKNYPSYNPELPICIPIIADGGIRENGDIPKSLVAGATMVMAGSIFAACIDAPGENVLGIKFKSGAQLNDTGYTTVVAKRYHGSASAKQKGERKHVEGFEVEIPCNNLTYSEKYQELSESLKSAVSYAGGKNLNVFKGVSVVTIK